MVNYSSSFTPQPLRAVRVLFSPMISGRADGQEKVCLSCISETVRCRKFIRGRDIGWGCRCATSWSDLDLTLTCIVAAVTCRKLILGRDISWCLVVGPVLKMKTGFRGFETERNPGFRKCA